MKYSRTFLLRLLSLAALAALLVSCSKDAPTDPEESAPAPTPETEAAAPSLEEPIPSNEVVDYQAVLGQWSDYLGYRAPEGGPTLKEALFTLPSGIDCVMRGESLAEVQIPLGDGQGTALSVYNLAEGIPVVAGLESRAGSVEYALRYSGAVIEVKATRTLPDDGGVTEEYDYYDVLGRRLNETPFTAAALGEYEQNGYVFTTVADKCYLAKDGALLGVFEAGKEHVLPEADLTYGAYRYVFSETEIRIFNESGGELARYERSELYRSARAEVLSDGRVMLFRATPCDKNEEACTAIDRVGNGYSLSYLLIDPAKGSVTEHTPAYALAVGRMITLAENRNTRLSPKGDYQYAEIYKISGGVIASSATPVILDNEMRIVTELPLILKDQTTLVGATDENHLMIQTHGLEPAHDRLYLANLVTCKISLYPNPASERYRFVGSGFLYGDTLYNVDMTESVSLGGQDYEILGNRVLLYGEEKTTLISTEGGSLSTAELPVGRARYYEELDLYEILGGEGRMLYDGKGRLCVTCRSFEILSVATKPVLRCELGDGWGYYTLQ